MNRKAGNSARTDKERKSTWVGGVAMTVGPLLALLIYFFLLEQCGFLLLDTNDDEQVVEALPHAAR